MSPNLLLEQQRLLLQVERACEALEQRRVGLAQEALALVQRDRGVVASFDVEPKKEGYVEVSPTVDHPSTLIVDDKS